MRVSATRVIEMDCKEMNSNGTRENEMNCAGLQPETGLLRIGFVGAGKAGTSFGKYISVRIAEQAEEGQRTGRSEQGKAVRLSGYFSKNPKSAASAAALTESAAFATDVALAEASDIIFFSVPDGEIEPAFASFIARSREKNADLSGKLFAHLSGSLASNVLRVGRPGEATLGIEPAESRDALDADAAYAEQYALHESVFSLHPACAIPDRETAWKGLRETCFVFEGAADARMRISPLLDLIGNRIGTIAPERKALYHAACVFLSNFSVALAAEGVALLTSCGLDAETSAGFLGTLFLGNAENVAKKGPVAALTGPAERGDAGTIRKHLTAIAELEDDAVMRIYRDLTGILLHVAQEKHPERDYSEAVGVLTE
jgi:predicted short-subunit dehydrogenase-like oxidoreductase (DUF2520 family)